MKSSGNDYLWEGPKKSYYLQQMVDYRDNMSRDVDGWFRKTKQSLEKVTKIMKSGINNLDLRIKEISNAWLKIIDDLEKRCEKDTQLIHQLVSKDLTVDYEKAHKKADGNNKDIFQDWMKEVLGEIQAHKTIQADKTDKGVSDARNNVITPLRQTWIDLEKSDVKKVSKVHSQAKKMLGKIESDLHASTKAYNKFDSLVKKNNKLNQSKKLQSKDTMKCALRLNVRVDRVYHKLKDLVILFDEMWDVYQGLLDNFCFHFLGQLDAFQNIVNGYTFPDDNEITNRPLKDIIFERGTNPKEFSEIFIQEDVEYIKSLAEFKGKEGLIEMLDKLYHPFTEAIDKYMRDNFVEQDTSKHNYFYWIVITEDLFLNIFKMEMIHGKRIPVGKAIVSESLDKIKIAFNESRRNVKISGNRPGSWSSGTVNFIYTSKENFNRVDELVKKGRNFVKDLAEEGKNA